MSKKFFNFLAVVSIFLILGFFFIYSQEEKKFSRDLLIQDLRQLAQIFEAAHPDPHVRGGGKIAFHRRFQNTLRTIPEEGMTVKEFYKHLLPFVASLGDGHTSVFPGEIAGFDAPGLPLGMNVVESCLYVTAVDDKNLEHILGAKLLSVEGIPFKELVRRQGSMEGWDNEYQNLARLCRSLRTKPRLEILLPEWKDQKNIHVGLKLKTGEEKEFMFVIPEKAPVNFITPPSNIKLPSVEKTDFVYDFLDEKNAILRIDGMFSYRENFEYFSAMGVDWTRAHAAKVYEKFHGRSAPDNIKDVISGIPSATETFRSLVVNMKKADTKTLLIDVRKNGGGNSLMTRILLYFLYGKKAVESLDMGYSVKKYSAFYFEQFKEENLERINAGQSFPLTIDDYDFSGELDFLSKGKAATDREREAQKYLQLIPTFLEEYKSAKYEHYYLPKNIVVLCSALTYSSGYDLVVSFYKMGATLVGVPSSQAGNCFGDVLMFKLNNTGISGQVSYKQMLAFPNDPERGRLLRPHFELTYIKLASYGFDPNAEILLALEIAAKQK